jgi:geranylgeranylglycerol-phosphate geranylgeranyltransferase
MRLKNSIIMGLAVLIGEIIAYPGLFLQPAVFGFLTAFTLTGAAMAINDYFDRYVDAVNEPERPLPKGLVSPGSAVSFSAFLSVLGLASAFVLGVGCLIFAVLFLALSAFYNARGKVLGLGGNIMVSACVAAPFLYGGFAVGMNPTILLMIFSALAFLANTGREITKGIADVEGDRLRGVKTAAMLWGGKTAAILASAFYLASVVLSSVPVALREVNFLYLPLILVTDLGFLYSSISILRDYSRENSKRTKKMVLIWMLLGLLALILGGLTLP